MRIRHIKGVEELIAAESLIIQKPEDYKGKWKQEIFGNDHPLFLEIGMGMGRFIRTHSFLHPDINYIGFELNTTVMYKAVQRYKAELAAHGAFSAYDSALATAAAIDGVGSPDGRSDTDIVGIKGTDIGSERDYDYGSTAAADNCETGLGIKTGNLRFIRSNARFLDAYFGTGEVDRIYLNFSDPWPKERSAGRRLTSPQFLKLYEEILAPDGVIEFKTDNRVLFDYSVETIPASGWKIREITYDLHNDAAMNEGNVMTEYEEKFSSRGNPIFKLIAGRS